MEDLIGCQDVVAEVTEMLKKLPDLERLLSRLVVMLINFMFLKFSLRIIEA